MFRVDASDNSSPLGQQAFPYWVFLHNIFGDTDPVRIKNQVEYLNSLGYDNIEFRLY